MKRYTIGSLIKAAVRIICLLIALTVMIFMFLIAVLDASYIYDPPQAYEHPSFWRYTND